MERKIGEVFKCNGKKYIVKEGIGCGICDIRCDSSNRPIIGNCSRCLRKDNKSVVFVKYNKKEIVMDNLLNCKGRKFKCTIASTDVEGKIQVENGTVYLCQNKRDGGSCKDKLGYKYSWYVCSGSTNDLKDSSVTDFKLIFMTKEEIENYKDWQVGDKITLYDGSEGEIIFRSGKLVIFEEEDKASGNYTIDELYDRGWRLDVEPEEETFVEMTMEEIAKLKGIPVEKLRIKDK